VLVKFGGVSFRVRKRGEVVIGKLKMQEANKQKQMNSGVWATIKPFVNGGASGMMAISVIQPVDMIKVELLFSL